MRITQGVAFSEFLHQPMHRRPPALSQPTFNFTYFLLTKVESITLTVWHAFEWKREFQIHLLKNLYPKMDGPATTFCNT